MTAARRIAMVVGSLTWLFAFSLMHDVRGLFDGGPLGTSPPWLIAILGVALLLTIGTAVTAAIRLPVWPWCAVASAVLVVGGIVGAHFAKLHAALAGHVPINHELITSQSLAAIFRDIVKDGALNVIFLVVAPTILVVVGIYGWLHGPRNLFAIEGPSAA